MTMTKTPLLKEDRLVYLLRALQCFQSWPMDRDHQRNCVLDGYLAELGQHAEDLSEEQRGHMDKSIFRGMVIPSLRYLGFIMGDGDFLRLSSNGMLAVAADSSMADLRPHVLASLIYEIDQSQFQYLPLIGQQPGPQKPLELQLSEVLTSGPSERQRRERVKHWLRILADARLVDNTNGVLKTSALTSLVPHFLEVCQEDVDWFLPALLSSYRQLVDVTESVSCSIVNLRTQLSTDQLKNHSRIVTRQRFDQLMQLVPFEGEDYMLSFGSPIGWGEDLIEYKNRQYSTLIITSTR